MGSVLVRSVVVLGLLMTLSVSADAAALHHARASAAHLRAPAHLIRPSEPGAAPAVRSAVPGWTDEQTEHWIDNATSCWSCG